MNGLSEQDFVDADAESAYSTESEDVIMIEKWHHEKPRWEYKAHLDRPLTEPPIFDYERFMEKKVPSNIRLKILFPDDIKKRTDYGDLSAEISLNRKYREWTFHMQAQYPLDMPKHLFYHDLASELELDAQEMRDEEIIGATNYGVTDMMTWEWENIDQDGGTTKIENMLKEGRPDVFYTRNYNYEYVPEAAAKYGQLASREYSPEIAKRVFKNFKREYVDRRGRTTTYLKYLIRSGDDVRKFYGWEELAEAKYGYLIPEGWRPRKKYEDGASAPDELYVDDGWGMPIFTPAEGAANLSSSPGQHSDQNLPPDPSDSEQEHLLSEPAASAHATGPAVSADTPLPNVETTETASQPPPFHSETHTKPTTRPPKHSITLTLTLSITPLRLFLLLVLVLEVWLCHHAWKEWMCWLDD